jgi:hypothetical protein
LVSDDIQPLASVPCVQLRELNMLLDGTQTEPLLLTQNAG